ncbi:hypothetical protein [Planctomycetes bacterium TBK1r]|uniref:Uncharacterized protein n=1 Tax=Stieleria magnilauensis TaxID=2527963 RepID=A0ABX5XK65_9BACT|nr:hypothetical protein TBK1r_06750 [Planctomycetes bacterium TBK1r]
MMDGTPDNWVGWQRWHGFIRAASLLGDSADRWLHIDRCMAMSWAIQTEADPENDSPNNPGLSEDRLEVLRQTWMTLSFEQLDWAFAKHRFRAPAPVAFDAIRSRIAHAALGLAGADSTPTYAGVQQILESASGVSFPNHGGHARFWLLPENEFLALPPIYGHSLIASPGEDRGARSALVKVLKGTLPGIPQMPLNQPPLSSDEIQYVEDWIDSLDDANETFQYAPPANVDDLNEAQKALWSEVVHGWFRSAESRLVERLGVPMADVRLFNLIDTPEGADGADAEIPWSGFPRKYTQVVADVEERWRVVEERVNADLTGRRAGYYRQVPGGFVPAEDIVFRDQDEYCEWHSFRDDTGELLKVVFTCENPEYWRFIAENDPNLLLSLYQGLTGQPVAMGDLFFGEDIFTPDANGNAINENGKYNPYNKWNTTDGIIHLTHPANSLSAEVFLAADASVLRENDTGPVVAPGELICCAGYGGPDRSSDPTIGAAVNGLVRDKKFVTINDPVGLYIHSLDATPFEFPAGISFDDCWKVIRGDQSKKQILRAEFSLPDGGSLSQVTVGGESLRFGSQIAEFISIVIFGKAFDASAIPNAMSCVAHCCTHSTLQQLQQITNINAPCPPIDEEGGMLAARSLEDRDAPLPDLKNVTSPYTR